MEIQSDLSRVISNGYSVSDPRQDHDSLSFHNFRLRQADRNLAIRMLFGAIR
jgi:hypothetical protein